MIYFYYSFLIFYIYILVGVLIWTKIDKMTKFENHNDEYLKLPIILGSFFSYLFIDKIKEKRMIYHMENEIQHYNMLLSMFDVDYLSEEEKQKIVRYNRLLKIHKIKNKI